MPVSPVFLSASIPDPLRDERYFKTGDTIAIRDAVIALVTTVLPRTKLVFGGHPAITPMVKWVADQLGAFQNVRMFQSKFFRESYIDDLAYFRYEEIEAVPGDREASLLAMRTRMIESEPFGAAFFIGGMEGVEQEYDLMREKRPGVPCYPVYTTGGAARLIWEREWDTGAIRQVRGLVLEQLRRKTNYSALFQGLLEGESGPPE